MRSWKSAVNSVVPSMAPVHVLVPEHLAPRLHPLVAHVPGLLRLPPGEAELRRRLAPLAAGCFARGGCPYWMYCPARLALASFASDAPET